MPLRDCMKQTSNREYLAWMDWLDKQWDTLDKKDWYLMQIAREIRGIFKSGVKLPDLKIPFGRKGKKNTPPLTREQSTVYAKARWCGLMTMPIRVVTIPKSQD